MSLKYILFSFFNFYTCAYVWVLFMLTFILAYKWVYGWIYMHVFTRSRTKACG